MSELENKARDSIVKLKSQPPSANEVFIYIDGYEQGRAEIVAAARVWCAEYVQVEAYNFTTESNRGQEMSANDLLAYLESLIDRSDIKRGEG